MHDRSIRAGHNRRHGGAITALLAAAALSCLLAGSTGAGVPSGTELSAVPPIQSESFARTSLVRDIAIETVAAGQEGIEFTARLTEDGGLIQRPIGWTIIDATGAKVYGGEAATADAALPPGDYTVAIRYGAVKASQALTVAPGTRLIASFVLDAGALRILPRLAGDTQPAAPARNRIYALGGNQSGELIASSEIPGEVIRLPAGDYRIDSRYPFGNAEAVTDVHVRAGLISAVEIDHKAGLAHLSYVGAPDAAVRWTISDAAGAALPAYDGLAVDAVLKPGNYTAEAVASGETLTAKFDIDAGQSRDIILGN